MRQANEVIYVGREYNKKCMLERNRCLMDHSSILLAVYNGQYRSGAAMTVRYARSSVRDIIVTDPTESGGGMHRRDHPYVPPWPMPTQ